MLTGTEKDIQSHLWTLNLQETIKAFDKVDSKGKKPSAKLAKVSLFYLITRVLCWREYIHEWSFERIKEVDQEPNGCIDLWFRGAGKTSIITVAKTIQDLIVHDNLAVIIFGNTYAIASFNLQLIKTILEQNETLKKLFPNRFYQDPQNQSEKWTNKAITIKRAVPKKAPSVLACGFEVRLPTGLHADILLYDDIVTNESVTTADRIVKTQEAYELSHALGTQNHVKRIIGTRYAFNDLFATLIEQKDLKGKLAYHTRIWPATDTGTVDGIPYIFSQEHWDKTVAEIATLRILSCQYLQDPHAAAEKVFDVQNLNRYEVRPQRMNVYILVDPATSKLKDSCDTAMVVIGVSGKKRKYLLDGFCHKMGLIERYTNLRRLHDKWRNEQGVLSVVVGYEVYGSGKSDYEYIVDQMKRERAPMRIKELSSGADLVIAKNDRIERINTDLIPHQIFVPYETDPERLTTEQRKALREGNQRLISRPIKAISHEKRVYNLTAEFIRQLTHFPIGAKKDLLDAWSRIFDMGIMDPTLRTGSYAIPVEALT